MTINENLPTEERILKWLRSVGQALPPASISVVDVQPRRPGDDNAVVTDAVTEITWQDRSYRFATELRSLSTPKAITTAIERARNAARQLKLSPLVVTPYLSEEKLQQLEAEAVSGLDLCGNGVIIVPGELFIYRTGGRNKFPRGAPIKNVYRGNSAIIARAFLLKPEYTSAQQLRQEVQARGGATTLSTISKVCKTLAEDLIIERQRLGRSTQLRLLQADKLLDALASNYRSPEVRGRFVGKTDLTDGELTDKLLAWQDKTRETIVRTGSSSTDRYATMVREPVARFYGTNVASLVDYLGKEVTETNRFASIELLETEDDVVYFDARADLAASPIQCFLELQRGDKREQDAADQVRKLLLQDSEDK